ncbi:PREDICTED: nudC domain-containing protein 3 [Rhagoletis zephyria]|uniref:nudC domain-containing protein 3 n=1 Tax=Rhagoletis zephyria TaxID=28612 RepID=UPI00081178FB|nr:PREDICTED: nudC domain-containing protein 3 [Rhagoletis zephyria]
MDCLRTDAIFMEILQQRKTVTGFLDAVFGFLRRNTDFYYIKKDPNEKIGFAKGLREQILFGAMQRYDPECKLNNLTAESTEVDGMFAPPAVEEVEVETDEVQMDSEEASNSMHPAIDINTKETQKKSQNSEFVPTDYKNGSCFAKYCWSQTLSEVELHVKLPAELNSAKSICIDIKPDLISVRSRANPAEILINGQISNRFKHNDAVWTITEGKLTISLDKNKEIWWEKFFTTEDSLDSKKIDCERYIDELPEDSQAAIQKLRVQQMEQDSLNTEHVTTDGGSTIERLRTAWDAEGSPFKGQPFDASMVKFS